MTGSEYQRLAMRTANPECRVLTNVGLGLAGEAGECADIIKKHIHHGHDLDKEHLKKSWETYVGILLLAVSLLDVQWMRSCR